MTLIVWLLIWASRRLRLHERTVTVMVIACPHALGLAVPLVVAVSTRLSASNGLLIRDRTAFERRDLHAVVFDKTGTLTKGRFGVTDIVLLERHGDETSPEPSGRGRERRSIPSLAASWRRRGSGGCTPDAPEDFIALPGAGRRGPGSKARRCDGQPRLSGRQGDYR